MGGQGRVQYWQPKRRVNFITLSEAAARLRVSGDQALRWAAEGHLYASLLGPQYFVRPEDVYEFRKALEFGFEAWEEAKEEWSDWLYAKEVRGSGVEEGVAWILRRSGAIRGRGGMTYEGCRDAHLKAEAKFVPCGACATCSTRRGNEKQLSALKAVARGTTQSDARVRVAAAMAFMGSDARTISLATRISQKDLRKTMPRDGYGVLYRCHADSRDGQRKAIAKSLFLPNLKVREPRRASIKAAAFSLRLLGVLAVDAAALIGCRGIDRDKIHRWTSESRAYLAFRLLDRTGGDIDFSGRKKRETRGGSPANGDEEFKEAKEHLEALKELLGLQQDALKQKRLRVGKLKKRAKRRKSQAFSWKRLLEQTSEA